MNNFVTTNGGDFFNDGRPFRFIGVNMYELAYAAPDIARLMMEDAVSEGFSVIRFWAFEPADKEKLKNIFNLAGEYKIKLIPVLADTWGYLQSYKIGDDWYKGVYKKKYISYITDITSLYKDQTEILMWELINEPSADSFEDIYNFTEDVSGKIKSADPNHLISIGTIGGIGDRFGGVFSRFNTDNFEKLYSLNSLDAVSIHDYSFNSTVFERLDILQRLKGNQKYSGLFKTLNKLIDYLPGLTDRFTLRNFNTTFDFPLTLRKIWKIYNSKNIAIAKRLSKPLYIGEIGFKKNLNDYRKIVLEAELKKYLAEGVAGILLWSFESQGKSLDGHDYGFGVDDGFGCIIENILISETQKAQKES